MQSSESNATGRRAHPGHASDDTSGHDGGGDDSGHPSHDRRHSVDGAHGAAAPHVPVIRRCGAAPTPPSTHGSLIGLAFASPTLACVLIGGGVVAAIQLGIYLGTQKKDIWV